MDGHILFMRIGYLLVGKGQARCPASEKKLSQTSLIPVPGTLVMTRARASCSAHVNTFLLNLRTRIVLGDHLHQILRRQRPGLLTGQHK